MITRRRWVAIRIAIVIVGAVAVVVWAFVFPRQQRSYAFIAYLALLTLSAWLDVWQGGPQGRVARFWAAGIGTLVTLLSVVAVYSLR